MRVSCKIFLGKKQLHFVSEHTQLFQNCAKHRRRRCSWVTMYVHLCIVKTAKNTRPAVSLSTYCFCLGMDIPTDELERAKQKVLCNSICTEIATAHFSEALRVSIIWYLACFAETRTAKDSGGICRPAGTSSRLVRSM